MPSYFFFQSIKEFQSEEYLQIITEEEALKIKVQSLVGDLFSQLFLVDFHVRRIIIPIREQSKALLGLTAHA